MNLTYKLCLAGSLLLLGCSSNADIGVRQAKIRAISLISPHGQIVEIQAEIADTYELRTMGLMNRDELQEGNGMLFIFENPNILLFWMKDTLIPLDIIFFDEAGVFVKSETMDPCEEEPCRTYNSKGNAIYALEVFAGFIEQYNVGEGWKLENE